MVDDILTAIDSEWMKREAERLDKQIREILKCENK
jgi:hypothetical protein